MLWNKNICQNKHGHQYFLVNWRSLLAISCCDIKFWTKSTRLSGFLNSDILMTLLLVMKWWISHYNVCWKSRKWKINWFEMYSDRIRRAWTGNESEIQTNHSWLFWLSLNCLFSFDFLISMIPIEYWTNEIWMMIQENITNSKFEIWKMDNG
jgi:hypothetical protein